MSDLAPRRPSRRRRTSMVLLAGLALLGPTLGSGEPPAPTPPAPKLSVLMIGNSLTYENDLPAVLEALLRTAGIDARVVSEAHANFGLEDHWRSRRTRRRLADGPWDFVVLQQGPSATEGRPSLLDYSKRFSALVRDVGAEPALYMVWPSRRRASDFPGVVDSYTRAAEASDALLLPVGAAWLALRRTHPEVPLYGPDGFHPSASATYLAAVVMAHRLAGVEPSELPERLDAAAGQLVLEIPPGLTRLLQAAAVSAPAPDESTSDRTDDDGG